MRWDVTRYAEKIPKNAANSQSKAGQDAEASLRKRYPPLDDSKVGSALGSAVGVPFSRPCIVVDMQGIILAWYLPGVLNDSRQVSFSVLSERRVQYTACQREMMAAAGKLTKSRNKRPSESKAGTSWRINSRNFPKEAEGPQLALNLVAAWFEQGHAVNCFRKSKFHSR